jgi:hypothetical protein
LKGHKKLHLPEQMQVGWVQQELGQLMLYFYKVDAPRSQQRLKKYDVQYQYLDYANASVSLQLCLPSWYMDLVPKTPAPDCHGFSVFASIGKHILCSL